MTQDANPTPGRVRKTDVLILGGGAAGLMCAFEAGRRGRGVTVLDHAERVGRKILISGGGRCNFTNLHTRPENFLSENLHFAKSALSRYTPADMVALVTKHGIGFHEKTLGQLFCDRSALDIVAMLERECAEAKVRIVTGTRVISVASSGGPACRFRVETSHGIFTAHSLIVATGGLSIPKMGATALGYEIARQFDLKIVPCRPALVPLVLGPDDLARWSDLSGLSTEVVVRCGAKEHKASFREKLLITHRGLSGPAVLQISSFWRPGESIEIDLAPDREIMAPLRSSKVGRDATAAVSALRTALPGRMAERWVTLHPPASWTNASLDAMERHIHGWRIAPFGTEGYAKAEVTVGGVDTNELDARTMESRRVPGLYFIGEVVDVTGWLGGYNFQWAWASAFSAGAAA